MSHRIEYQVGESIGLHGCKYIEEREPYVLHGRSYRIALFECGYCGNRFKTRIARIRSNFTASCGCLHRAAVAEAATVRDRELPVNIRKHGSTYEATVNVDGRKIRKYTSTLAEAIETKKQLRKQFIHD